MSLSSPHFPTVKKYNTENSKGPWLAFRGRRKMMVKGCCSIVPSLREAPGQGEAKTLKTRAEVLACKKQGRSQDKALLPSSSK